MAGERKFNFQRSLEPLYSVINDNAIRCSLRLGETILSAASKRGLDLAIPTENKGDEWLQLTAERTFNALRLHGNQETRKVLKEARKRINGSQLLNGDKPKILEMISSLMHSLGQPQQIVELPQIPFRNIVNSSSKE